LRKDLGIVMDEYPKINTIWRRDEKTHQIIEGDYSCSEFKAIKLWHITEKIDGTNIRVIYHPHLSPFKVEFRGKTDNAEISLPLLERLGRLFSAEQLGKQFEQSYNVVLYGEGYGGKIQSGKKYCEDCDFILFDALIDGYWLEPAKTKVLAHELNVGYVPELDFLTSVEAEALCKSPPKSAVGNCPIEGIVARSVPLMLFRKDKTPIMWKLKVRDYTERTKVKGDEK